MTSAHSVAALPMYDWPELRDATDAFWAAWRDAIRARGGAAPERLTRDRDAEEVWRDPALLVSQTCGWPFVDRVSAWTRLVATPIYDAPGCDGPTYTSMIVTRADEAAAALADFDGRRMAINSYDSLSGWRAAASRAPSRFEAMMTGGHRASALAVAHGEADVAAIDAVCWAFFQAFEPEAAAALKVIGRTDPAPALPYVAAAARSESDVERLRAALDDALTAAPQAAEALRLTGWAPLTVEEYRTLERFRDA